MTMMLPPVTNLEILALLTTGYVSGLSILSGFALSAINQLYVKGESKKLRELAWLIVMMIGMVSCTLGPIFIMVFLVFGDNRTGSEFWWRMTLFAAGVGGGSAFSFISAYLIGKKQK
jgi:hypothetical protein